MKLKELVPTFDDLMGVKAVYGPSPGPEAVMCFGPNGNDPNKKSYYSHARTVAEDALAKPYFITLGGGAEVIDRYRGKALEVVKATGVYGKTEAFVKSPATLQRLKQWPSAIVLTEVYEIVGEPSLVDDLGFENMNILANAFDGVRFYDEQVRKLWNELDKYELRRRWDVAPPPLFSDPGKLDFRFTTYPTISTEEGKKRTVTVQSLERKSEAANAAKERNKSVNGGKYTCEACAFSDATSSLFDAHHLQPLATGPRISTIDSYAILCPLCHRFAHFKAQNVLLPLPLAELRRMRTQINI